MAHGSGRLLIVLLAHAALFGWPAVAYSDIEVSDAHRALIERAIGANESALRGLGNVSYDFSTDYSSLLSRAGSWRDSRGGSEVVSAAGERRLTLFRHQPFRQASQPARLRFSRNKHLVVSNSKYSAAKSHPGNSACFVFEHASPNAPSVTARAIVFENDQNVALFRHAFGGDKSLRDAMWATPGDRKYLLEAEQSSSRELVVRKFSTGDSGKKGVLLSQWHIDLAKAGLVTRVATYAGIGDLPGDEVKIELARAPATDHWFPVKIARQKRSFVKDANGKQTLQPHLTWTATLRNIRIDIDVNSSDFTIESLELADGCPIQWADIAGKSKTFLALGGKPIPEGDAEEYGLADKYSRWLVAMAAEEEKTVVESSGPGKITSLSAVPASHNKSLAVPLFASAVNARRWNDGWTGLLTMTACIVASVIAAAVVFRRYAATSQLGK